MEKDGRASQLHLGESVGLFVRFPPALTSLIKGQFHAKYPDCQIEQFPVDALDAPPGHESFTMELRLRPDLFPIIRYQQYEDAVQAEIDDPVGGVLQSLAPDWPPGNVSFLTATFAASMKHRTVSTCTSAPSTPAAWASTTATMATGMASSVSRPPGSSEPCLLKPLRLRELSSTRYGGCFFTLPAHFSILYV